MDGGEATTGKSSLPFELDLPKRFIDPISVDEREGGGRVVVVVAIL